MSQFSLVLFSTNPDFIRKAVASGVDSIIVDWENAGKVERQRGYDTQISRDTLAELPTTPIFLGRFSFNSRVKKGYSSSLG